MTREQRLAETLRAAEFDLESYVYDCEAVAGDAASLRVKGALQAVRAARAALAEEAGADPDALGFVTRELAKWVRHEVTDPNEWTPPGPVVELLTEIRRRLAPSPSTPAGETDR